MDYDDVKDAAYHASQLDCTITAGSLLPTIRRCQCGWSFRTYRDKLGIKRLAEHQAQKHAESVEYFCGDDLM